mmetsp:Transcript_25006/g.62953  ORF Transcript_25006/g.62953 Transcript_25006/m.62953 type:complete len:339 (+) Transcript_25006:2959-3975(+)
MVFLPAAAGNRRSVALPARLARACANTLCFLLDCSCSATIISSSSTAVELANLSCWLRTCISDCSSSFAMASFFAANSFSTSITPASPPSSLVKLRLDSTFCKLCWRVSGLANSRALPTLPFGVDGDEPGDAGRPSLNLLAAFTAMTDPSMERRFPFSTPLDRLPPPASLPIDECRSATLEREERSSSIPDFPAWPDFLLTAASDPFLSFFPPTSSAKIEVRCSRCTSEERRKSFCITPTNDTLFRLPPPPSSLSNCPACLSAIALAREGLLPPPCCSFPTAPPMLDCLCLDTEGSGERRMSSNTTSSTSTATFVFSVFSLSEDILTPPFLLLLPHSI